MKNIKKILLLLVVMVSSFALMACGSNPESVDPGIDESKSPQIEVDETVTIKHELGETIVDKNPKRIIVFDYGILDAIDNIGEDIIGLPKKSVPPYLEKYKADDYIDVGSLQEPNFEKIYELEPDLIIISARQASLYEEFEKVGPTVYLNIDGGDYMNSFKNNMETLGEIFDKKELLGGKVGEIEEAINKLGEEAKSKDVNGLFIMANDGNLSAFGRGSRFGILFDEFGVTPVDEGIQVTTHGDKISFEYIVEKNPEYLYIMDRAAVAGGDISAKQVMDNDLIKSTDAYKNDRIIYLDAHTWYVSSGGLTGTMKMVEEIRSSLEK